MKDLFFWRCITALALAPIVPLAICISLGQFGLYIFKSAWRVWMSLIGFHEVLDNTRIYTDSPSHAANDDVSIDIDDDDISSRELDAIRIIYSI